MQHSKHKPNKINSKIRTLCTIDTSDIDLRQLKPKTYSYLPVSRTKSKSKHFATGVSRDKQRNGMVSPVCKAQKSRSKFGHERKQTKVPISPPTQKHKNIVKQKGNYFAQTQGTIQKSPSQDKFVDLQKSKQKDVSRKRSQSGWNKTMTRSKSRVKTEHSTLNDAVFKSLLSKSSIKSKAHDNSLQQTYNMDTFEILDELPSEIQHVKLMITRKHDKLYLLKKTKNNAIKQQFQNQQHFRQQPPSSQHRAFNCALKQRNVNIEKLYRMYIQKSYLYALYEYNGGYLSWNNETHVRLVANMVKNDGEMLRHVLKQIAKGIHQLSGRGFAHGRVRLENISVQVQDRKNVLQMQGNVKLCNLHNMFPIGQKQHLVEMPGSIYTPPQLINLKLFETGQQFDRELLQCISYYDEAWYIDVWALGVLMLELIAGEQVSIEKVERVRENQQSNSHKSSENGRSNGQEDDNLGNVNIDIEDDDVSIRIESERTHDENKNKNKNQDKNKDKNKDKGKVKVKDMNHQKQKLNSKNKQEQRNKKSASALKQQQQQHEQNNNNNQNQITLADILQAQKSLLIQTQTMIQRIAFDKKLHNLLIRMLAVNPLDRPSPKDIIRDL